LRMKNRTSLLLILAVECLLLSALAYAGDPLIWEDQFDLGGKFDQARGIAVSGRQAVVIGIGQTATGEVAMLVRAYESATGMLEWHDQTPIALGFITNVVIAGFGDEVFGAGYLAQDQGTDFLVRAYDAKTGNRLWEDIADKGRDDIVLDIAASHAGVFAVGYGGNMGGSSLDFWYARMTEQPARFSGKIKSITEGPTIWPAKSQPKVKWFLWRAQAEALQLVTSFFELTTQLLAN